MPCSDEPLVSIVTPVYNGGKYLSECIESILAQTYNNWDYVIVNNCSTDNSLEIASEYARRDKRIRIHNNTEFLDIYNNFNNAVRQISNQSKYCKIVHADDFLFPNCLTEMVQLMEANPEVAVVGAYGFDGRNVLWDGLLSYHQTVVTGQEVCREALLKGIYIFGSPTTTMLRADKVRERTDLYNVNNPNPDVEVCYELLQDSDFGFVHQVLTFTRFHDESQTSLDKRRASKVYGWLITIRKFGPLLFNKEELDYVMDTWRLGYLSRLVWCLAHGYLRDFWSYNTPRIKAMNEKITVGSLLRALFIGIKDLKLGLKTRNL